MPFFVPYDKRQLKSILSNISVDTPALFWLLFTWTTVFQSFTFKLFVSFDLKWVSCRQDIVGS